MSFPGSIFIWFSCVQIFQTSPPFRTAATRVGRMRFGKSILCNASAAKKFSQLPVRCTKATVMLGFAVQSRPWSAKASPKRGRTEASTIRGRTRIDEEKNETTLKTAGEGYWRPARYTNQPATQRSRAPPGSQAGCCGRPAWWATKIPPEASPSPAPGPLPPSHGD